MASSVSFLVTSKTTSAIYVPLRYIVVKLLCFS